MIKKFLAVSIMTTLVLSLVTGCTSLDVVGKEATRSFDDLMKAVPNNIQFDTGTSYWTVNSPTTSKLLLSASPDQTKQDALLIVDAKPFLEAGLKPETLPENYTYDAAKQTLSVSKDLGDLPYDDNAKKSVQETFNNLVAKYRDSIGYHEKLDHYGIALGDGNMFEWAKTLSTNDKDMVFVLNPEPLIKAGVKPEAVKGWVFAQVEIKDGAKTKLVDKFLMPFQVQ